MSQPVTAEQFIQELFGKLPEFYSTQSKSCEIFGPIQLRAKDCWTGWMTPAMALKPSRPYGNLWQIRILICSMSWNIFRLKFRQSHEQIRVAAAEPAIYENLSPERREFVEFVLSRYIETGVEVLDRELLPELLKLKYEAIEDAIAILGSGEVIAKIVH